MKDKRALISRDKVSMAHQSAVASACVSIFDRIQNLPKHVQLLGLAGAFLLLIEASNYPAQDVLSSVTNLMVDKDHTSRREARFAAMKFHLREELLNDQA